MAIRRYALGVVLVAALAAWAIGPKVGEPMPELTVDPINDDADEEFDFAEEVGEDPAVIAFVLSDEQVNQQLAMGLEQAYRTMKEKNLHVLMYIPAPADVRDQIAGMLKQFGIQMTVAVMDPGDGEALKEWELKEAKTNCVVLVDEGKVTEVMPDVKAEDASKLQEAVKALVE